MSKWGAGARRRLRPNELMIAHVVIGRCFQVGRGTSCLHPATITTLLHRLRTYEYCYALWTANFCYASRLQADAVVRRPKSRRLILVAAEWWDKHAPMAEPAVIASRPTAAQPHHPTVMAVQDPEE
ncbi:hypothetical protein TCAP_06676 [Tolypocladium capitatum]|uniref:Uncharacterized protein n=1 Tax=Tolypocladium capitatum TaxID=45235 RepID=A0A2K3Q767_9HYPO|nr:hypothetical protein TCAP_06676 [Tolypocladium capitatum]